MTEAVDACAGQGLRRGWWIVARHRAELPPSERVDPLITGAAVTCIDGTVQSVTSVLVGTHLEPDPLSS
jgi:hypothetical protein